MNDKEIEVRIAQLKKREEELQEKLLDMLSQLENVLKEIVYLKNLEQKD